MPRICPQARPTPAAKRSDKMMCPSPMPANGSTVPDPEEREDRLVFMKRLIHDLNNALSVVTINVGLLRDDPAQSDDTTDLVEEIAEAASKASGLTGQLGRLVNEARDSFPNVDPGPAGEGSELGAADR